MSTNKKCLLLSLLASVSVLEAAEVAIMDSPLTSSSNKFYLGNRVPPARSEFIPLPIGSGQPKGWLLAVMERQRDGLCGHLAEISAWLTKRRLEPRGVSGGRGDRVAFCGAAKTTILRRHSGVAREMTRHRTQ